ncbi:uncharacterized protein BP01DRAFT_410029 [Aspergillus saccharolyticus JOP 1030-1]|uniref:GPI anchored protein n=1 Tax=Aspergillus saccharolyticus JOP 1030-1 TaxID=1450539 RepID=A0A318Z6M1_9EURO|nr:hypothetical protein BP01DRAFT_410029 [Aspergillus saccharolyticus JOP 1030-1]PYH40423.1 hypothetical protein BP01DRAFT_410029 [Aspergillus saccharolyticus JOP 1030-1]
MFSKTLCKFTVLLAMCFLASVTLAVEETFDNTEVMFNAESFVAIPLANDELNARDITIIKTICETSTSVISTTGPVNPPVAVTTGQPSSQSESQIAPPPQLTSVTGTAVQPPVTSNPEGASPTSAPGTTVQSSEQPPVPLTTEAAPIPSSNTQESYSLPYTTSASHSASSVSSTVHSVTHSTTTLTTSTSGTSSAASGTSSTAPPSSAAADLGAMRTALWALAATFAIFVCI